MQVLLLPVRCLIGQFPSLRMLPKTEGGRECWHTCGVRVLDVCCLLPERSDDNQLHVHEETYTHISGRTQALCCARTGGHPAMKEEPGLPESMASTSGGAGAMPGQDAGGGGGEGAAKGGFSGASKLLTDAASKGKMLVSSAKPWAEAFDRNSFARPANAAVRRLHSVSHIGTAPPMRGAFVKDVRLTNALLCSLCAFRHPNTRTLTHLRAVHSPFRPSAGGDVEDPEELPLFQDQLRARHDGGAPGDHGALSPVTCDPQPRARHVGVPVCHPNDADRCERNDGRWPDEDDCVLFHHHARRIFPDGTCFQHTVLTIRVGDVSALNARIWTCCSRVRALSAFS